jgi:hypothetical protein
VAPAPVELVKGHVTGSHECESQHVYWCLRNKWMTGTLFLVYWSLNLGLMLARQVLHHLSHAS